jgi:hypothetical protein
MKKSMKSVERKLKCLNLAQCAAIGWRLSEIPHGGSGCLGSETLCFCGLSDG